jgi:hypothetical protein
MLSRLTIVVVVVLVPIYITWLVFAYSGLLDAWQMNDWGSFWSVAWSSGTLVAAVRLVQLPGAIAASTHQEYRASILQARQAAILGDDTLAPPVALPNPPAQDEYHQNPGGELYLHRPDGSRQTSKLIVGIILLIFGVTFALVGVGVVVSEWQPHGAWPELAIFGGLALALLLPGLTLLVQSRVTQRVLVRIDGKGLSWRHGRQTRHVDWHQLEALTTIQYRRNTDGLRIQVFVLDTPDAVLAWQVTTSSPAEECADHTYLSERVVRNSSLVLRNLTEAIVKLHREAAAASASLQNTKREPIQFPLPTVPATLPERPIDLAPVARTSRKIPLGCVGLVILLLPGLLLFPLGWGAQHYEPYYYNSLVQRVHAELPHYTNSFATDYGDWLTQKPTPKDRASYTYADSSYQLTGGTSSDFLDSWRNYSYTSIAVEVSVKQIGTDPQNDGIGLVLHVNGSRMEVFDIDAEGDWNLWAYDDVSSNANDDWNLIDSGWSSHIHRGTGATNRLLAIVHGNQYFLYVNDAFLAVETVKGAPSSGYIGVYSNDASLIAAFTNFAIYPSPSLAPALPWGL